MLSSNPETLSERLSTAEHRRGRIPVDEAGGGQHADADVRQTADGVDYPRQACLNWHDAIARLGSDDDQVARTGPVMEISIGSGIDSEQLCSAA